jgi:hypothetical protein
MNGMIKCGIINDCINESSAHYSKLEKYRKKIVQNLLLLRKITDKQINDFKNAYKVFAKHFFSKKTIKCMNNFCKPTLLNYAKIKINIDELKKKILVLKTKFKLLKENKNYLILMDTMFVILGHFGKNYQRFFEK